MENFEKLKEFMQNVPGAYKAAQLSDDGYKEIKLRPGAGAHNTYSLSKSVTSCAVGILEEDGKLKDTDTVFSIIGDLFPDDYDKKWETVTLADVMHHKTGVAHEANIDIDVMDFWEDGRSDFLDHFLSQPIKYEPGKGPFVYCDTNYYLIGRVVGKITGMTLGEFLQKRMFNKLKWRGHAWGTCPDGHTLGGTGLFATARDLCAYGYMLACGGVYNGEQILTEKWIEKARGERGGYGYGFSNSADGRWFFTGGMYGQGLYIFPETRTTFCVLGHDVPVDAISKKIVPEYLK